MGLTKSTIQPPFDIDAQRFIYATGITNFNQKRAINYLVKGLKQNNLWSKMAAVYPMVGGTAWTCKFNLINPRNSILANVLTFVANPTISIFGVAWNGTNQYADTNLNPSTATPLTLNSTHFSYYSRSNTATVALDCGCNDGNRTYLNLVGAYEVNTTIATDSFVNSDTRGFFIVSRTTSILTTEYRNGASVATSASASGGLPNLNFYIGARNNVGSPLNFTDRQCAFLSIGSGLSSSDSFNFYSVVNQFQIILGRNV